MTQPNPVAFSIGGLDVRWYGILIGTAMCLAVIISCKRAPRQGMKEDDVLDVALWMLPVSVIGARAYYVLFNHSYYHSLSQILNIRNGGLAIHGGLIFGIITIIAVCHKKGINPLNFLDLVAPSVALAQAIGRWGNFFNGEAHGGPTNLPWAITVNGQSVHPTFLYESIWCLILFFALSWFNTHKRTALGETACLYGILYSIERFLVEALRTDSLMIGPFKQAQILSLVVIISCALLYNYCKRHKQIESVSEDTK